MAGTGYGDFSIETPTTALAQAANANTAVAGSQLAQATLPDQITQSGVRTAASQLALADAQKQSQLKNTLTDDQLIARAASLATNHDEWDQAMQDLVDQGIPSARQFIGRYSSGLQGRVASAYSAPGPTSALSAMQSDNPTGMGAAASGLASVGNATPAGVSSGAAPSDFDRLFANQTGPQIQQAFQRLEATRQAIVAVQNSPNPAQEWDKQAAALGMNDYVGKFSPLALQQLAQETVPADNYLRGRLAREGMGIPTLPVAGETKEVGGVLYERNPQTDQWVAKTPKIQTLGADQQIVDLNPATSTEGAMPLGDFVQKLQLAENATGNPGAKNPASSATGNGQFIAGTWLPLIKQEMPALAAGKTDAQLLALRSDPAVSAQMTQAYARNNGVGLSVAGDPVTGTTLAMAHRIGLDGAKAVLAASPDTPMSALISDAAIKANPQYAAMTAGDFTRSLAQQFGNETVAVPGLPNGAAVPTGVPGVKVLASGALLTDGNAKLSDDATNFIAETYVRTGQLPPLGMGKQATQNRNAILDKAAEIEQQTGKTGTDAVLAWSNLKADRTALNNLAKTSDMIKAFEGTALANADQVLQLAPQGVGGSVPIFNRWINAGRSQVEGDPAVTRFNTAIGTFADEYAKVVSGGTGSQAVTDSSRAEAYSRINSSQTLQQLQNNIAQMKIEMENRRNSLDTQRAQIESRISGGGAPAPVQTAAAAPQAQVPMRGGYPVLTPDQARAWAQVPGNAGKKWVTTDGRQMAF